ncbi:hypothetical protein MKK63_11015 [Methylobacterium sp. J-088]|uniref:hypothetical protein n=1 Tax=Methylobacterium sp. J-088 TaxID=2836664 RepID=UPI001FBBCE0C|nr:hypothetical protein [Methylobacterium sp. J-088]MCJ2063240.1 hypothetical protein [Methylobacterium sp. J-088]
MSGGVNAPGQMSLADFMRLYAPTALPQATPVQSAGLAALGQSQPAQQPTQKSMGFTSNMGQGQQQQGGSLPFLGQGSQSGPASAAGQAQPGQGGLQQLLINAMQNNSANGTSNRLADAVGYVPFGTGSFG